MWVVNGYNLQMTEGDYGIELPVIVTGTQLTASDSLKFAFKRTVRGGPVLEKEFENIQNNTVNLAFTSSESEKFPIGSYVFSLDWYRDGQFMCNIITVGSLKVVEKA